VALDPEGAWQDPAAVLSHSLALDPASALSTAARRLADARPASAEADDWLASWRAADERAAGAIGGVLAGHELSEPRVAAELGALLAPETTLFVASSMPVRDIETFWPVREDPPRVLCNRGANGIDGTVSAAFGVAAHADGPVVLLIGDVALAHDLGGLLAAKRLGLKLTVVLLDNGGGGIFDFLALAGASMARAAEPGGPDIGGAGRTPDVGEQDVYSRHIATPTGLDFGRAAALYDFEHEPVQTVQELRLALERALAPEAPAALVHVRTSRAENVALHRRVWEAVARRG
jgi:2-succinyl-5-enolpyruvyl-6-hydroxy-3-cyclohexene-1-carboxylate synthase